MNFTILDEKTYAQTMENTVEPFLASKRQEGTFNSFDGSPIHYEYYLADNARANVVISHGFTESAEKFREMSYYFLCEGYNVFAVDHRGHGKSFKENIDDYTVYVSQFNDYIKDLYNFVGRIVELNNGGLPMYLYGHSMGGGIAIRFIEKHPEIFSKAVLNAPMVQLNPSGLPLPVARVITSAAYAVGMGKKPVVSTTPFNPNRTYENSHDTSEARYNYYHKKRIANPCYQTSRPSYNWLKEGMKVTAEILDDENCKKVTADVLLLQAEKDTSVLLTYQDEFISKIKSGKLIQFKGAKHEIYLADNPTLEKYLPAIFDFLEK